MTDNLSELDILYLPSRWSKRLSSDIIVQKHLELVSKASESVKQSVPNKLDIAYGQQGKEKYDIFGTDLKNGGPIFIFIHGGYWQEESITRDAYWFLAEQLYRKNIKSIFIGYELCPKVTMVQIVDQINAALSECIKYAKGCETKDIYIAGHSAGAHLVATLFTEPFCRLNKDEQGLIRAAFLISGIYDLLPLVETHINDPLKLDVALAKKLSPQHQKLAENNVGFHVIAARNDSPAFVDQAEKFHAKLRDANMDSTLAVYERYDHFDIIECLRDGSYQLTKTIIGVIGSK